MKPYPYLKVGLSFVLCPGIAGLCFALAGVYELAQKETMNGTLLLDSLSLLMVVPLGAIYINIPPAITLAAIYLALRLYRSWQSYLLVTLLGGCGAFLWVEKIIFGNRGEGYWQFIAETLLTKPITVPFLLGAISSLAMAFWVLPKKEK